MFEMLSSYSPSLILVIMSAHYSGRKAARVKFWVAFANSSLFFINFFFCVAIGQEITDKTSYMTK